ncbi:hypothetical protein Pfo_009917 [Paulownia fortunei]|nr:hypothetical protein Pfo_009917 [Paulownia fortunei]
MSNSGKKTTEDDEVEQLLRAAQDDVLLKLNLNSHMARASASAAIDPDLDRRFQALKKPQKPTKVDDSMKRVPTKMDTGNNKVDGVVGEDDLIARFAALKNSLSSYNRDENKSNFPSDASVNQQVTEGESEDEVEKVIKWAMDAARLDPSPPSDDDDDNHGIDDDDDNDGIDDDDGSDDDDNDGSDDDDGVDSGKKGKRK